MFLGASHHVRILGNSFQNNGGRGVSVFPDSTHNLIKGNLLSRNGTIGIGLEKADRNQVRRNRVVRDGVGIFVFDGDRNVIAGNRIAHAIQHEGEAIELPRSDHNVIVRNSIRDTTGIAVHVGGVGNVVRRNHISGAGKDGLRVVAKAKHILCGATTPSARKMTASTPITRRRS